MNTEAIPSMRMRGNYTRVTSITDELHTCMFCSTPTFRAFDTGEGCCDRCAQPFNFVTDEMPFTYPFFH